MGLRYPPYAFTEQGVAMLSKSRPCQYPDHEDIYTKLREMTLTHKALQKKVESMEGKKRGFRQVKLCIL
ncbi:MAG: hypothetical protein MAG551_01945 [Candidatus Scalindua arabica]|uniref:Uncharacterized protein n=1 Tax=Candidatus Scalindua arabica TaxID=1127984 RepID=A0A941W5L1_9BACT|nr:hypothetical protein [Candidatus Scalindua arabica]